MEAGAGSEDTLRSRRKRSDGLNAMRTGS
jgi:hypothetical protein